MVKKIFCGMFVLFGITTNLFAETWNCGSVNGVNSNNVKCVYDENTQTLTISGEGKMRDYSSEFNVPWHDKNVVNVVIDNGVTSMGDRVFKGMNSVENIRGTENITSIGIAAFLGTSITSLDLPSASEIRRDAFYNAENLEYIRIPQNVSFWTNDSYGMFRGTKIPHCRENSECGSCGEKFVQAGVGCVSGCWDGYYANNFGICKEIKLRYTLPEADEATSDDNENMIEWIFE